MYQLGHVAYETDASSTVLASFSYDSQGVPTSVRVGSDPTTAPIYYYVYNGHGDTIALTDATGTVVASYTYDAWGVVTTDTESFANGWHNPYLYDGRDGARYDQETGLYWLSVRAYDPTLGRFISRDPLGRAPLFGWADQPYVYAGNNPLTNVDPTGQRMAVERGGGVQAAARPAASTRARTAQPRRAAGSHVQARRGRAAEQPDPAVPGHAQISAEQKAAKQVANDAAYHFWIVAGALVLLGGLLTVLGGIATGLGWWFVGGFIAGIGAGLLTIGAMAGFIAAMFSHEAGEDDTWFTAQDISSGYGSIDGYTTKTAIVGVLVALASLAMTIGKSIQDLVKNEGVVDTISKLFGSAVAGLFAFMFSYIFTTALGVIQLNADAKWWVTKELQDV